MFGDISDFSSLHSVPSALGDSPKTIAELRQESQLSINPGLILPIEPGGCIRFTNLRGAIVDLDETIAGNSGHVHDSWRGKFSVAFRAVLEERGLVFNDVEWRGLWEGTAEQPGYGRFKGRAANEIRVALAQEALRLHGIEVPDHALAAAIDAFYAGLPSSGLAEELCVVQRATAILKGFSRKGIGLCLCTASEGRFVDALRELDKFSAPLSYFDQVVAEAQKKDANGFSATGVREACLLIGMHPEECIMLGDNMNDIGAAAMAGIRYAVIRPPGQYDALDPMQLKKLSDEFHRDREKHLELRNITVLVVASWDQLRFDHAPGRDELGALSGVIEEGILSQPDIGASGSQDYQQEGGAGRDATSAF